MFLCVYTCVCVCVLVCVRVSMCVCMYVCVDAYLHVRLNMRVLIFWRITMLADVCVRVYVEDADVHVHVCMYFDLTSTRAVATLHAVCKYVDLHSAAVRVTLYTCMHVCMSIAFQQQGM